MYKSFYALEKNTRREYFKSSDDLRSQIIHFSPKELQDGKREIMLLSNILALPGEVDMEDFKAPKLYTVDQDGTANIQVSGILSTQVDWCAAYFNEATTTYGFIRAAAIEADEDPEVKKIRFNVSTPGGIVTDLDFTSQVIWNIKKPTETVGFGMVASAGIYLFSQTDKIISADPSVFWGSIGVAVSFIDRSKRDKAEGVQRVELASDDAPDKRPDLSTEEGRHVLIKELNDLHKIFVGRVAAGRNVTPEFVNKNFGKGGVLIAEDALKAGLIDQVDLQLNQASEPVKKSAQRSSAEPENKTEDKHMDPKTMTLDEFLAQNANAKIDHDQRLKSSKAEGDKVGAERVQAEFDGKLTRIMNVLGSDDYPAKYNAVAVKAGKNEISMESFDTIIAMADIEIEDGKTKLADEEAKKQKETPAGTSKKSENGKIANSEDLEAEKELFNQMKGKKAEAK